ncbi:unnamed protein product [Caretta caretta]
MPKPLLLQGSRPRDSELGWQFGDWCLRTYGDSAKTKTVTRRKYHQLQWGKKGKFQFWVQSKGFRLGSSTREAAKMGQVVYVPVKTGMVSARYAPGTQCLCLVSVCPSLPQLKPQGPGPSAGGRPDVGQPPTPASHTPPSHPSQPLSHQH